MRCQDAKMKLTTLAQDALPPTEREQLLEHLDQCEACSDELIRCAFQAEIQEQSSTDDDSFVLAVMEGLPPQPQWAQPRPSWLPPLALGLVACLLLVIGVSLGWVETPSLLNSIDHSGAQLAMAGCIREVAPRWLFVALMVIPIISTALLVRLEIRPLKG